MQIERIQQQEPIGSLNMDAEMSFILASEAAKWAGLESIEGPYNATANGTISLAQLVQLMEQATSKRAKIALLGPDDTRFPFSNLDDWLPALVQTITKKLKIASVESNQQTLFITLSL